MKTGPMLSVLVFFCGATSPGYAEVIQIPVGQQAPQNQDLPRPTRGMSEEAVLERFGLPESKSAPVGDPPISKWTYPAYTVYFESSTVIHSVLTHTPSVPAAEVP